MSSDPRFLTVPRNWSVNFLPYAPDESVESVIGYKNPNRGYGYGHWVEYYERESDARERFEFLRDCGAVERMELRKADPAFRLLGRLMSDWSDSE